MLYIEAELYRTWFFSIVTILGFVTCFMVYFNHYKNAVAPPISKTITILFCVGLVLAIAYFPPVVDKELYEAFFLTEGADFSKDVGWNVYNEICRYLLGDNSILFFLLTASIYVYGNYKFFATCIQKGNLFYAILLSAISLGFFAHGVNTLRAGFALSLLLIAFSRKRKVFFVVFALLSLSVHKTMLIPLSAFLIAKYLKNPKICLGVWALFLIVSAINIPLISNTLQLFMGVDERVETYLFSGGDTEYKVGFRWDFLIYSLMPIAIGCFYIFKKKFQDDNYIRLVNTYLLANAIWLLMIRMPFSDRTAYLSWFLIPVIVLYPLLKEKFFSGQYKYVAYTIGGITCVNLFISMIS